MSFEHSLSGDFGKGAKALYKHCIPVSRRNFIAYMQIMDKNRQPDTIDWKILKELQKDGKVTNVDLATLVGLSPPPTLRRVQALEQSGYITGYRAQLDRLKLGYEVEMIVLVGLKSQAREEITDFERQIRNWPVVRECYALQGVADFMLKCVARDLPSLQSFIMGALSKAANVESVKTSIVLHVAKDEPLVPLP
jgi:DNA-binding Lrp family transcriptional regulator